MEYREGVYVGYRYYDSAGKAVRYPFGYGLSYTSFAYTDLEICWPKVSVTVTNTGHIRVRRWYSFISVRKRGFEEKCRDTPCNNRLFRPEKELKGYVRLELDPGESKKAEFLLDDRSFAVWHKGWKVPEGNYAIMAASSSRDIRLQKVISMEGVRIPAPEWQKESWYKTLSGLPGRERVGTSYGTSGSAGVGTGAGDVCSGQYLSGDEGLCSAYENNI